MLPTRANARAQSGKTGASEARMGGGRKCCFFSVVIFTLFFLTHGQFLQRGEAANSKFLPVVINTWGPPFTNATAEGKPKITFEVIPSQQL